MIGATNENVNFDVRVLNNNWTECDYKIRRAHSVSSIWNHKYDLRPKLHDTKFNYHFIKAILKTQNSVDNNVLFNK